MGHYILASTIVTGGTTSLGSLSSSMEFAEELIEIPEVDSTLLTSTSSTLTTAVANALDENEAKTAQAVGYVETYSEENINELVNEIDVLIAENEQAEKGYTRTLKK